MPRKVIVTYNTYVVLERLPEDVRETVEVVSGRMCHFTFRTKSAEWLVLRIFGTERPGSADAKELVTQLASFTGRQDTARCLYYIDPAYASGEGLPPYNPDFEMVCGSLAAPLRLHLQMWDVAMLLDTPDAQENALVPIPSRAVHLTGQENSLAALLPGGALLPLHP